MRLAYISSAEVGYKPLQGLIDDNRDVVGIVSMHSKKEATTSGYFSYDDIALNNNISHTKVKNINSQKAVDFLRKVEPDVLIVCGWQQLLKKEVLKIPKVGSIGFHSSLLPKYRGRAPVNWAIIKGETETGVTAFFLEEEADAGDIIAQHAFPIEYEDDCATIYQKVSQSCDEILKECLPKLKNGTLKTCKNEASSLPCWPKRSPEDGRIDFNWDSRKIYDWVRALTKPYPGAWFIDEDGNKILIWKAKEGNYPELGRVYSVKNGHITLIDFEKTKAVEQGDD
jgi:methionyl-tRNA formyltransferase